MSKTLPVILLGGGGDASVVISARLALEHCRDRASLDYERFWFER